MSINQELEVDRLRAKFPRSYKALVQLYPAAWDQMLAVVEAAMAEGKTASVVAGKLSILRGLDRPTRRWVMLCMQADRREIMLRGQKSFLTELFDRSLDDILAELNSLEAAHTVGGVRQPPRDESLPRGFVFVSHHRNSAGALADETVTRIETHGYRCWVAPRDVPNAAQWNEEVYGAAQRCSAMILLLNEAVLLSRVTQGEVHIAVARNVPVFVVRLADVDPATVNVGLLTYQHIDWFADPTGEVVYLERMLIDGLGRAGLAPGASA